MATFQLSPIGHVRGGREDAIDDDWGQSRARIELDPDVFHPEADVLREALVQGEVDVLIDRRSNEKAPMLSGIAREVGAASAHGKPYRRTRENHARFCNPFGSLSLPTPSPI